MKLINKSSATVKVAGIYVAGGRQIELNDERWHNWLQASSVHRQTAAQSLQIVLVQDDHTGYSAREHTVSSAIKMLPKDEDVYRKDGVPKLNIVKQVSGLSDITADELQSVWSKMSTSATPASASAVEEHTLDTYIDEDDLPADEDEEF